MVESRNSRRYFADTWFWVALINQGDSGHDRAKAMLDKIRNSKILTSELVLIELLNFFASRGRFLRELCIEHVDRLKANRYVHIVPHSTECFSDALELYRARPDQRWSLTDCSSILLMKEHNVTYALTNDHHFTQAGLILLDPA
jgi:predicted nucleic acid-binding protein